MIKTIAEKYKSFPLPVRASFFFVFCGMFKDAVDVISTPIFTRLLTTEEYGLFGVYNSWFQVIRIIFTLNIFNDAFNVGLSRYREDSERYASSQQGLLTTLVAFWAVWVVIFREPLASLMNLDVPLLLLMLVNTYFSCFFTCWFAKQRYFYNYKILTAVTVVYTALQPLVGIILVKNNIFGCDNGHIRVYSGVGVQLLFGVIFFTIQFFKNRTFFKKEYWRFSLKINIPLLPHYLSQILLNQSDKIMIDQFCGKSQAAIYSVAHSAAFVIQAVTTNLIGTLTPWLYEKLKIKDHSGIKKTFTILVALVAVIVFALVTVAPEAMMLFAGDAYMGGKWVIPPLAFSVYLIFVYMLFSNFELYFEKSKYILVASVVGALSNIILNFYFIRIFGYLAAGYTTVAGYVLMLICHIMFTKLTCKKENLKFGEFFNVGMIVVISLVLAGLCVLAVLAYDFAVIRYCVLAAIIAACIIFRNKIIGFIKSMKTVK